MRRLLFVAGLAVGATVAQADNGSFYFGAGVTSNKYTIQTPPSPYPDVNDEYQWKVFAGFRPISAFAVEADYLDLGSTTRPGTCTTCCMSQCEGVIQTDARVFAAYAVGFLPIPLPILDVYGKAGLARSNMNTNVNGSTTSNHGTDFAWGIGVQAHIRMFGARFEYEQFNVPNTSGAKVLSLSALLNF